jgi:hypothetical protein
MPVDTNERDLACFESVCKFPKRKLVWHCCLFKQDSPLLCIHLASIHLRDPDHSSLQGTWSPSEPQEPHRAESSVTQSVWYISEEIETDPTDPMSKVQALAELTVVPHDLEVTSRRNACDLYSVGSQFESRIEYILCSLSFPAACFLHSIQMAV